MRILLFAATKKGLRVAERLTRDFRSDLAAVCSFREANVTEIYFSQIQSLCQNSEVEFFDWKDVRDDIENIVEALGITHVFLVSWGFRLPTEINKTLKNTMIVFHDSLLPRYRGFAPLPTAIIKGEEEIGFSVLFAEEEIDTGDVILQRRFLLPPTMYISEAIDLVAHGYSEVVPELIEQLRKGSIKASPQDETKATYSVWRDDKDREIDWKQSSKQIYDFIRALGGPYGGAYTFLKGQKISVFESHILPDLHFEIRQPGKLWNISGETAAVICGSGMLKINKCFHEDGSLVKFSRLRVRLGQN